MSSVTGAGLVQIPRNSHFRPIPYSLADRGVMSTSVLTFVPTTGVAPVLTVNSSALGATGNFISTPWMGAALTNGATAFQSLSTGAALLKDMGDTIVSAGRTFRRVQLLNYVTNTEQNGGTYTGADSDALCGYIEVGFRGTAAAGPFVRGF